MKGYLAFDEDMLVFGFSGSCGGGDGVAKHGYSRSTCFKIGIHVLAARLYKEHLSADVYDALFCFVWMVVCTTKRLRERKRG